MTGIEKCVIIGSGPSAWTAALYAARANLRPLVFGGRLNPDLLPGGQLMTTTEVENFPGFPEGITGPELLGRIREQAMRFDVRVATDEGAVSELADVSSWQSVERVDLSTGSPFTVFSDAGTSLCTHCIIIATGASAKYLGLLSEKIFYNRGVSACAVCDGAAPRFRNKPIAVVGGGDTAMEEAIFLTKFASIVYLVHRREVFRASKVMLERARRNPRICFELNTEVAEVLGRSGSDGVTAVRLRSTVDGTERELPVVGVFLAIGHQPNTKFLQGQLKTDELGYLVLPQAHRTNTSVPGVFASGDVADFHYRQAITAAGTGCAAALDAEKWLSERGLE